MAGWYGFFRNSIFLLVILGLTASVYAYYVEKSKEMDSSFKAACDFSPTMSCSKVFTSRFGRGFGLVEHFVGRSSILNQPNSVFGILFYLIHSFLGLKDTILAAKIQVVLSLVANCGSLYLAYILYFILNDFCIVCVSTYIINFLMLLTCIGKFRSLSSRLSKRQISKKKM